MKEIEIITIIIFLLMICAGIVLYTFNIEPLTIQTVFP